MTREQGKFKFVPSVVKKKTFSTVEQVVVKILLQDRRQKLKQSGACAG